MNIIKLFCFIFILVFFVVTCSSNGSKIPAPYLSDIKSLYRVILKSDFNFVEETLEDIKAKNKTYIEYDGNCYKTPFSNSTNREGCFSFESYLLSKSYYYFNRIEMIDWKGEEEENQFSNYVKNQLKEYNINDFSTKFWDIKSDKFLERKHIENGEYIIHQFETFDRELRKINFYLLFIHEDSDAYYPFIVNKSDYEKINGLIVGEFKVGKLDCWSPSCE